MTRQVSLLQVVIQAFISIDERERENVHIIVPQKMFNASLIGLKNNPFMFNNMILSYLEFDGCLERYKEQKNYVEKLIH